MPDNLKTSFNLWISSSSHFSLGVFSHIETLNLIPSVQLFDLLHLVHVLHDVDRLHQMSLQLRISSEEKEESSKHRFLASVSPVNREAVWCQAIHR